jgi:Tol biopolymer transport system component
LNQYQQTSPAPADLVPLAGSAVTPGALCPASEPAPAPTSAGAAAVQPSSRNTISQYIRGRIAVPLYNSSTGEYNIHLYALPQAQEIGQIRHARQPNFWADGQRLLFRRPEANGGIYQYNFADGAETLVSEPLNQQHPFYDPWGSRLVYGNQTPVPGANGSLQSLLFVQCSLLSPQSEAEQSCRNMAQFGVLLAAGPPGEIQGAYPVWTLTDMIAYNGCTTAAGVNRCGIYSVASSSTRRLSDGLTPRQLTDHPTDTPSDTKGNFIAFSSQRMGNWEAFIMNLDGSGLRNLSDKSLSQDGLPVISPDGYWVAFLSNRDGPWAVWVASVDGLQGQQKLFDLPTGLQVGMNDQDWLNERLAWGP